jgi:hypothetical protein
LPRDRGQWRAVCDNLGVGGLASFGPVGLLPGPLAVALFLALLRIYERDYRADPSS